MPDTLTTRLELSEIASSRGIGGIHHSEHLSSKRGHDRYQDTLAPAQRKEKESQVECRPALPKPTVHKTTDFMLVIAKSFCESFDAMHNGLTEMIKDYKKVQEANQTMSDCVLQSTTDEINKQKVTLRIIKKIQNEEERMSQSPWHWILLGLGIAVMLATFASGFFDEGASDTALGPEGVELADLAGDSAVGTDEASAAASTTAVDDAATTMTNAGEDGGAGVGESTNASTNEMLQEDDEESTVSKADGEKQKARVNKLEKGTKRFSAKWIGKRLLGMALSGLLSSPTLVQAIQSFHIEHQLKELAYLQGNEVGPASAKMQMNTMYYEFYEKVVQREGGAIDEQINESTEIIQDFANITNAVKQITYGLAQAV